MKPTNLQLRYNNCWPTWKTGTNLTTDREQFTSTNAPTARLPTLVTETGRNLNTRLAKYKRALRNGDASNYIAVHQLIRHNIDWDSDQCLTFSTNCFQRLTLESWYINLEPSPPYRCQQLRRLTNDFSMTETKPFHGLLTDLLNLTNSTRTKNRPIWLTIDGSKPTNGWWQTLHESFSQYPHG